MLLQPEAKSRRQPPPVASQMQLVVVPEQPVVLTHRSAGTVSVAVVALLKAAQVPSAPPVSIELQDMHAVSQTALQQTPSTQKPLAHS